MVTTPQRYRLATDQYDRLIELGVIPEGTRVELLEGELIQMPAQGVRHVNCLRRVIGLMQETGVPAGTLLVQMPLRIGPDSEPEPDLVVLRPPADQYDTRPAGPADVLLLVEVADRSREYDRDRKLPRYARAGIAEVWLVDLHDDLLRVYRDPVAGAFQVAQVFRRGQTAQPRWLPAASFPVDRVLGPTS